MKTMSVREFRQSTPRLKETLAREGEVLLVSNGEPIARLMPIAAPAPRPKLPSLKEFRASQPKPKTPIEQLIREERDRR
jgi:antitoxin (DNA-binding transcriptional repressor) of toxin-antitoxin stability system